MRESFDQVLIPPEVLVEIGFHVDWIHVRPILNESLRTALSAHLGKGEAAAIALATEATEAVVILDDRKARREAEQLGLSITRTVGLLLRAKRKGIIGAIQPILLELDAAGFHLSETLRAAALNHAGEDVPPR